MACSEARTSYELVGYSNYPPALAQVRTAGKDPCRAQNQYMRTWGWGRRGDAIGASMAMDGH